MIVRYLKNFGSALMWLMTAAIVAVVALFVGQVIFNYAGPSGVLIYLLVWIAAIWAAVVTELKSN